ncbi:dnaJ homolog subfamily C member 30, mitochondrial [Rhipicephalus sanguineus]|uniref:J domain-containing protein n=1 Tax=Rhipicephalus sanguineus TaxID=34632 RepID=A0A9D4Q5Y2_RHISA|nr:dnaJ homolog subfamily C member 30, mitochondrial [Rhipicephalus sanguineus]KAH7968585.1 hypothetical protein HPB52_009842 [Rhipicephalus sanguineus]
MRAATSVLCRRYASSSAKRTYYDVLEVSPSAKPNEIKAAYYRLSMRYHPDKNKGSSGERFQEITTAYDTLSNESLRAHYDDKIMGGSSSPLQGLHARKPTRRAPMGGRSQIYNFDEFYRQHYGDAVKSYQWRKQKYEDVLREEEMQIRRGKGDAGVAVALFAVVALALFGVHVWEKMHDTPSSPPQERK